MAYECTHRNGSLGICPIGYGSLIKPESPTSELEAYDRVQQIASNYPDSYGRDSYGSRVATGLVSLRERGRGRGQENRR